MRCTRAGFAVLAAALLAIAPARAQQAPAQEPSLPDRMLDGLKGFFESIFKPGEGQLPAPQPDGDPTSPRAAPAAPASPSNVQSSPAPDRKSTRLNSSHT